jgi:tungstate transport system ATP-binding protein
MDALHDVGLDEKANRKAHELSSGEAQRLAIARAIVVNPDILFLDEPTASLDPDNTKIIEKIIHTRNSRSERITIMVTHNLYQAKSLSDFVIFMYKGRIMEFSAAEPFFKKPETELARKFVFGEVY